MGAKKLAVFVLIILLLVNKTAAPRQQVLQLTEEDCKALLSAVFTGTVLSDGHGNLLVDPLIMQILEDYSRDQNCLNNVLRDTDRTYIYRPKLTAAYGVNCTGDIVGVYFSDRAGHAEEKLLNNIPLDQLCTIAISFSPCEQCVERFEELVNDARHVVLQFASPYKYHDGIWRLDELGYRMQQLNTGFVLDFLFQQKSLDKRIKDALWRSLHGYYRYYGYYGYGYWQYHRNDHHNEYSALSKRDNRTLNEIIRILQERAYNKQGCKENSRCYHDRRDDDDNEPGTGNTRRGGGGGGAAGGVYSSSSSSSSMSSSNDKRTTSSQRDGAAQNSPGWSFSRVGLVIVLVLTVMALSIITCLLYRSIKVSPHQLVF